MQEDFNKNFHLKKVYRTTFERQLIIQKYCSMILITQASIFLRVGRKKGGRDICPGRRHFPYAVRIKLRGDANWQA